MKTYLLSMLLVAGAATTALAQNSVLDFYKLYQNAYESRQMHRQKLSLIKKNVRNGFLQYRLTPGEGYQHGVKNYTEEMAYFISNNGRKFVVVASSYLEPQSGKYTANPSNFKRKWGLPRCFEIRNGKLTPTNGKYIPLATEQKMIGLCTIKNFWIKLPETGTTIKIGSSDNNGTRILGELRYNVTNGSFRFVKL